MIEKKSGMTIRKKLLFSYFAIVALLAIVCVSCVIGINEVYSNGNEIYVNNLRAVEFLKSINQNVRQIDQCVISMMSTLDKEHHDEYLLEIKRLQTENTQLMDEYSKLDVDVLEERRYNQCCLSILTLDKHIKNVVGYLNKGDIKMAKAAYEQELMPAKSTTYELIDAVVDLSTDNATEKNADNYVIYNSIIWIIGVVMVLAIISAIIIAFKMSRYFTKKLDVICKLAKRISEYNIADDIVEYSNDEFGDTMEALNVSQFMMRDLMEKIIDESSTISDTGEEVSLAVRKSCQRIEDVNVKVLQSGSMAEGMDDTVRKILENRKLDEDTVKLLKEILVQSDTARGFLDVARAELSSIAMYLEQIGITSDYQNEIANTHRDQVKKFKV